MYEQDTMPTRIRIMMPSVFALALLRGCGKSDDSSGQLDDDGGFGGLDSAADSGSPSGTSTPSASEASGASTSETSTSGTSAPGTTDASTSSTEETFSTSGTTRESSGDSMHETGGVEGMCSPAHDAATPALTGPYCVGVSVLHLVDESRDETLTSAPGDKREVLVYLFYPILPGSDNPPVPWIGQKEWPWLLNYGFPFPSDGYKDLWSNAVQDEDVAPGIFPVVTFMPGFGAHTSAYTGVFVEPLVSRGFIVAAVNHPYVSGIVNFPDGRSIAGSAALDDATLSVVVGDARFVLSELEVDPRWQDTMDFGQIGSFGHSFGGATSAEVLVKDDRFLAGIVYDGRLFGDVRYVGTPKPVFLGASRESGLTANAGEWNLLWAKLSGPGYYARIADTTHLGLSDAGLLAEHFNSGSPQSLGLGAIAPKRLAEITDALTRAFFDTHLRGGDPAALFEAAASFAEITFQTK